MKTFRHLIANSTFIMPKGKVITFAGPTGGAGVYTTEDPDEIKELSAVAKMPTTQLEEVAQEVVSVAGTEDAPATLNKPADPAVKAAVADAAASADKAANPKVAAAAAKLGDIIAAAKGQ